jgi:hypothetical protein
MDNLRIEPVLMVNIGRSTTWSGVIQTDRNQKAELEANDRQESEKEVLETTTKALDWKARCEGWTWK